MKKKKKAQEVKHEEQEIVKPDLSYKKKEPQLIDLEEAFMETRYHFEEPAQKPSHQPIQDPAPQPKPVVKPVSPAIISDPNPTYSPQPQSKEVPEANLAFLGAPTTQSNPLPSQ